MYYDQRILQLNILGWFALIAGISAFLLIPLSPLVPTLDSEFQPNYASAAAIVVVAMMCKFKGDLHIAFIWPLVLASLWLALIPTLRYLEIIHPYPLHGTFPFNSIFFQLVLGCLLVGGYGLNAWIYMRR